MDSSSTVIQCPVCACGLSGPVDICVACQTPHHQDCARFIGRCAVFACGAESFVTSDAAAVGLRVSAGHVDGDSSGPWIEPQLGRGAWARTVATWRMLASNPSLTVPLAMLLVFVSFVSKGLLTTLGVTLVQSILVIAFVSQARGKQSTLSDACSLFAERSWRIVKLLFMTNVYIYMPMLGGALVMTFSTALLGGFGVLVGFPIGMGLMFWAWWLMFAYMLVPILASLGETEEPGCMFQRSAQLISVGRMQLVWGGLLVGSATLGTMFVLGGALGMVGMDGVIEDMFIGVFTSCFALVWTTYLILFYLEARQILIARGRGVE